MAENDAELYFKQTFEYEVRSQLALKGMRGATESKGASAIGSPRH